MERDCGVWINILAHKMKKRLNATFSDMEVTGVQSQIMHYIIRRSESAPVFQRDVEEAFSLSRSTATGILQLLEKNGIIRRNRVENDGRLKSLLPTEKAVRINAQVHAGIREMEAAMTRGISAGQMQLFLETAARMSDNLDD
ncbi:MAG: MarR family winged helix-turn-helix transcriptional regulator [Candidatus Howiella sp.]|jgi:MarR family transcriptional repressor of mepA